LLRLSEDHGDAIKHVAVKVKGRGTAVPLQAWTDPENSMRLRLLNFKTVGT
jgi:hypothetical protein